MQLINIHYVEVSISAWVYHVMPLNYCSKLCSISYNNIKVHPLTKSNHKMNYRSGSDLVLSAWQNVLFLGYALMYLLYILKAFFYQVVKMGINFILYVMLPGYSYQCFEGLFGKKEIIQSQKVLFICLTCIWNWDLPCIQNHIGTREKWPPSGR